MAPKSRGTRAAPKTPPNHAEIPRKAFESFMNARKLEAEWAEVKEAARQQIEDAMGDAEYGDIEGTTVITWKTGKRTALDQKLLAQLYPEVLAECKATGPTRTFKPVED